MDTPVTWTEALIICTDLGARLCTVQELANGPYQSPFCF